VTAVFSQYFLNSNKAMITYNSSDLMQYFTAQNALPVFPGIAMRLNAYTFL